MEIILQFIRQYHLVTVIIVLSYLGVFFTILLDNRNPAKSLAYILLLVFLPVLGLIVYYFFGRDLRKKRIFSRKVFKDADIAQKYLDQYSRHSEEELELMEKEIGDLVQPFRHLYVEKISFVHTGNKVTLLTNGEEKFPALFEALEKAQHHIHIEYYILSKDDIGNKLTEILLRKASKGVKVRVIVDDRGSNRIKDIPQKLMNAGIEVYKFMPVRFGSLAQANYRNHRKIVVIDGKAGFVGGINLDDRYLNNGKHKLYWRDTHMLIEGPAVKELQFNFFKSLSFVAKKQFELDATYFPDSNNTENSANVSIAASGPASPHPFNMEVLLEAITQAKKSIKITNPYFIPSDQILTALELAAAAGVDVELIIPGKSDSFIVAHASFSYLTPLIARGVKVYLYDKGFVHAKTMVVDGKIGFVGTVNMDIRSFYINFEIAAIVQHPGFCAQMEAAFARDKANSHIIIAAEWANRSRFNKLLDSVCHLLTPLL
ncbi:MAG: cardiolipin synthase [Bacteroidetes bacterium]|nr:cardiolipin synthase [Bacteroidota bacterium]MBS1930715.1 cardiolipin synthase [Bacteroidota bacterium]